MNRQFTYIFFVLVTFYHSGYAQNKGSNHEYFVSFDDLKIAFTDRGSGQPIILLHGFINTGNSWDKSALKKDLLAAGYRVIVPDLRGNGRSDQPEHPEAYQNDAEVKDLIALANHLKLESYMAIGYSRGSIVLAKLLTLDPRIKKAVIGGMGADFTNPNWERRLAFADAFNGRAELTELTRGAVTYAKSINANLKILGLLQDHQPVTSVQELQDISIPIRIVCGDTDVDNGDPKQLQESIPKSELQLVSGDHNNTYKQQNFADAILEFLRKN
ncbi:MAG: alpha/beta hydrolase [Bacteroidota bacterium]